MHEQKFVNRVAIVTQNRANINSKSRISKRFEGFNMTIGWI